MLTRLSIIIELVICIIAVVMDLMLIEWWYWTLTGKLCLVGKAGLLDTWSDSIMAKLQKGGTDEV